MTKRQTSPDDADDRGVWRELVEAAKSLSMACKCQKIRAIKISVNTYA
jgi:hypothetical protein